MAMSMGGQDMTIKVGKDHNYSMGASLSLPLIVPSLWSSLKLSQMDIELAMESARSSKIELVSQIKQAYYTYVELGGHLDFANSRSLALAVGAALNKSCYNGYEKGFGICNVELKYTHPVVLKSWTLPLSAAYIINPVYRKSFVNFTASLAF